MSPWSAKVNALVGQAVTQAGSRLSSPIAAWSSVLRSRLSTVISARRIRWMQKVHFSMMPRLRTVMSLFSWCLIRSGHTGSHQLKNRA